MTGAPERDDVLVQALERMAHQIKNPLQAVAVNLEVIRSRMEREAPESWREVERFADAVDANVQLLDRRLRLLLDLGRRDASAAPVEVDAASVAREFAAALRWDEDPPGVRVEGSSEMAARVRPGELLAILVRLWGTALDAGAEETRVAVAGEGGGVRLTVSLPADADPDLATLDAAAERAGGRLEAEAGEGGIAVRLELPGGGEPSGRGIPRASDR